MDFGARGRDTAAIYLVERIRGEEDNEPMSIAVCVCDNSPNTRPGLITFAENAMRIEARISEG